VRFSPPPAGRHQCANLDPTLTTDTAPLPITVGAELTAALELALAQLGAEGATPTAINDVVGQLEASAWTRSVA
jgi:hypothetical protein